jgi:chemotaxis protein histidine kinase CheA
MVLAVTTVQAQVTVTTNLPATAASGSEFLVELSVEKPGLTGFAKLEQSLPSGFEATAEQTANATFSFKGRKVKFLWMALPNADTFTVSYKVKVDATLTGNQILEGKFAYIKDNATEKYIIPKDIIAIGADPAAAAEAQAMAAIEADAKAKADAESAAREAATEAEEPIEEVVEETADVIEEVAEEVAEEVVEEIDNSAAEAEVAAAQEAERKSKEAELERLRAEKELRKAEQAAKAEEVAEEEAPAEQPATNYNDAMLKSKAGLVFRVQVSAGPNQVDPALVASKLGVNETVMLEENEGMFKYVVGEFGSYRPSKTFSNSLRDNNGVEGPFVTAYKDGIRIHVKEALDLAGQ